MSSHTPRLTAGLAFVAVAVVVLAGCGGGGKKSAAPTTTATSTGAIMAHKNAKIAAEVPKSIQSKGTLTVAADATYAPNEFIGTNGHTVMGMSPDLGHAIGDVL